MGRTVYRALVENTGARGRREVGGAHKRHAARWCHQSAVSESVSALCVRCVDGAAVSALPKPEIRFSWLYVSSEEVENSVGQTLRQFHSGYLHKCCQSH